MLQARLLLLTSAFLFTGSVALAQGRQGVVSNEAANGSTDPNKPNPKASGSAFSIGTLYGVAAPLYELGFYRVSGGTLTEYRGDSWSDYVNPAVFVLPSVAIASTSKTKAVLKDDPGARQRHYHGGVTKEDYNYVTSTNTWSVIIPAGLAGGSGLDDLSIGLGGAYGWTTHTGVEVGVALAMVWQQAEFLTKQQRPYLGQELPAGVGDQIETRLRPSAVFGLYILPTF